MSKTKSTKTVTTVKPKALPAEMEIKGQVPKMQNPPPPPPKKNK